MRLNAPSVVETMRHYGSLPPRCAPDCVCAAPIYAPHHPKPREGLLALRCERRLEVMHYITSYVFSRSHLVVKSLQPTRCALERM